MQLLPASEMFRPPLFCIPCVPNGGRATRDSPVHDCYSVFKNVQRPYKSNLARGTSKDLWCTASAGCHPATMGLGPVPAVKRLFERTGLTFKDMELVELNEAFAAQVLAVLKEWGWEDEQDKLNVNGSGISLGHPIAATGVRILTTLLNELERSGGRHGLETMCIGGGQGLAAVFERG